MQPSRQAAVHSGRIAHPTPHPAAPWRPAAMAPRRRSRERRARRCLRGWRARRTRRLGRERARIKRRLQTGWCARRPVWTRMAGGIPGDSKGIQGDTASPERIHLRRDAREPADKGNRGDGRAAHVLAPNSRAAMAPLGSSRLVSGSSRVLLDDLGSAPTS